MAVLTRRQFGDLYNSIKSFSTTTAQHPRAYNTRIAAAESVAKAHQKAGFEIPARLWSQLAEDLRSEKTLYRLGSQVVGQEIPPESQEMDASGDRPFAFQEDPEPAREDEGRDLPAPRAPRRTREKVAPE